ncbi:LemA family protein [uncultured Croceicoccus sp.]|uniref:LemA family protein n=1 Tax=uncultured Croceicoccus sp. TaxID=1295329 RepID=UPI00260E491B|nr:LemA family protein [uncultured Croceicoccus sp.]
MPVLRSFRIAVAGLLALGLSACGINSVPTAEENAKARWADVQSAYQRRADLVPNLVATVRAAAQSETQILTNVTEARARATGITVTTDDLSDPAEFQRFQQAQNQLTQALGQLRTVVENYPQLQSQGRFADLMVSLESSENRIDTARTRYNDAVQEYNTEIRTFPSVIGAKIIHGAEPMQAFTAEPSAQTAPDVDFGNMGAPGMAPGAAPANDNSTQASAAAAN